jgi:hypothetical protein
VSRTDQNITRIYYSAYYENLTEDEEHKGEDDISYDYGVATELQVISHPNHKEQEDHWYGDYP